MRAVFDTLAEHLLAVQRPGEDWTAYFSGESTDFVRFNHARVRQPGSVTQADVGVTLVRDGRQASAQVPVCGSPTEDRARLDAALVDLRGLLPHLPQDPHLNLHRASDHTDDVQLPSLPPTEDVVDVITAAAAETDMVGILASGPMYRGFASSVGQRDWFGRAALHLDYSLVLSDDKAYKDTLATSAFDADVLRARLDAGRRALADLALPPVERPPGAYRAWLTPAAAGELLELLCWGGFSARELDARKSPLARLYAGDVALDGRVSIAEETRARGMPSFGSDGFRKPERVALVRDGRAGDRLVSPRSAVELGLETNGASGGEGSSALTLGPGQLDHDTALGRLDTGIWVSNLWYANWSDRSSARATGMTRFATFWVEGGRVVGPLRSMRFDDSLYRLLGEGLIGLGSTVEDLPNVGTYGERGLGGMASPGWLVDGMRFTL